MSIHGISVREAAVRHGITLSAVYQAINAGRLTPIRDRRPKLLDLDQVDEVFGRPDVEAHLRALIESAPPLTSEQAERLRALLREAS